MLIPINAANSNQMGHDLLPAHIRDLMDLTDARNYFFQSPMESIAICHPVSLHYRANQVMC